MDNTKKSELEGIKKEYLLTEQRWQDEKACLSNIIYVLGRVVAMHEALMAEYEPLKKMVASEKELPLDDIKEQIEKLKSKIFTQETKEDFDEKKKLDELKDLLLKSCRIIKKIVVALVDDFYPISGELKARADAIEIDCQIETAGWNLERPATELIRYIKALKSKISEDFKSINNIFLILLKNVKELEKTLTSEYGQDARIKEIEAFETNVNAQVGSIANTFTLHSTIDEIKSTVVEKLSKIKQLVALRKKEEIEKTQKAQESINKLKQRIKKTENDARAMAKQVDFFQTAANTDGLTGVYNRSAFDRRINQALKLSSEQGVPVSLFLFDIDNFKWINDTLGHVAGDKVLKIVAVCLQDTFRKNDFIARYGGDEFAVVIEKLGEEIAKRKILEFEEFLKNKRFLSHKKGDIDVTASAGMAFSVEGDSAEDLIQRADENMYRSKQKKS